MRNTGIEYSSTEKTPVVLPELMELLPSLDGEQFSVLEADILKNGCYSPIIVDENLTIVDGHHRQKICQDHDIPYRMLVFSFEDMLEANEESVRAWTEFSGMNAACIRDMIRESQELSMKFQTIAELLEVFL